MKAKPRPFTKQEDQFLLNNYMTIPAKRMSKMLSRSESTARNRMRILKIVVPPEITEKFKKDSRIKPGSVPANKGKKQTEFMSPEAIEKTKATRFQPGCIAPNKAHYKDGDITLRSSKKNSDHYYIRLKRSVWQELQIYNWEKAIGPVPDGHVLACIDGNTLNCDVSNWKLITMTENAQRNSEIASKGLSDNYVASLMSHKDPELRKLLKEQPKLLELKRSQLTLNRIINAKQKSTATA